MKVEFHPAAEQELAAAVTLGEQRSSGLGGELLAEAQRIAELLCDTPNIGEAIDARHRRFPSVAFRLRSYIGSIQAYCASSRCRIGDKDRDTGVVGRDR
jgi:hypothetical protein